MNKQRLLTLATFLEKLPRKRFDFSHFVGEDWKGAQDLSCGTTACAVGWCPVIPAFKKLGLRIVWIDHEPGVKILGQKIDRGIDTAFSISMKTAERLFDLTETESKFLFVPSLYDGIAYRDRRLDDRKPGSKATPKAVARHIRKFVERGGIPS